MGNVVARGRRQRQRQRLRYPALTGLIFLLVLAGPVFSVAARETPATPAATPVATPSASPDADGTPTAGATLSSEEELVRRFAPVLYLKRQPGPCNTEGEQFFPAPVDVVFGDDGVVLWQTPPLTVDEVGIEASHVGAKSSSAPHAPNLGGASRDVLP